MKMLNVSSSSPWPAAHHFLDVGLADAIIETVGPNASILDVGAGSGQYGAYFLGHSHEAQPIRSDSCRDAARPIRYDSADPIRFD